MTAIVGVFLADTYISIAHYVHNCNNGLTLNTALIQSRLAACGDRVKEFGDTPKLLPKGYCPLVPALLDHPTMLNTLNLWVASQ